MDREKQRILFTFDSLRVNKDEEILRASSFDLYESTPKRYCRCEYKGPNLLVWNSRKKEACLTNKHQVDNNVRRCFNKKLAKYFEKQESYEKADPSQVIQIQYQRDHALIYCHPFNISIYIEAYQCPDHVSMLSANSNLTINNEKFDSKYYQFIGEMNLEPDTRA